LFVAGRSQVHIQGQEKLHKVIVIRGEWYNVVPYDDEDVVASDIDQQGFE
jgi:hypothetical protein